MEGKKTKGRQRLPMEMIQNTAARSVTFSKRKDGLFKKASELATLCNADVALVAFSPSGRPFSFGSPSLRTVLNSFAHGASPPPIDFIAQEASSRRSQELTNVLNDIAAEKERGEEIVNQLQAERTRAPLDDDLTLGQLKDKMEMLTKLLEQIQAHKEPMMDDVGDTHGVSSRNNV
ncbi:Transcription factor, MADS-box [Dillenia turbinata]|uniref:Transcription factor, MADS-box n=1 Tax=Dillenia turbinata TaxID=194707 RepID=A0AAN8VWH3_9MAGN